MLEIKSALENFSLRKWFQFLLVTLAFPISLLLTAAFAEENGALFSIHPSDENILIIEGNFDSGAYREYRRFLRENNAIDAIVVNSLGGLIDEALDIAQHVHDTGISVSIPAGNKCYSACSFLVFASPKKEIEGEIGIHKFNFKDDAITSSVQQLTSNVQATVGEIIDLFMAWEVPAFVLPKMFLNDDIYILTEDEKRLLLKTNSLETSLTDLASNDGTNDTRTLDEIFEERLEKSYDRIFRKPLEFRNDVCLFTRPNARISDIARSLLVKGVIEDEASFIEVFSKFVDPSKIKQGNSHIPANSSMYEIAETITNNKLIMCGHEVAFLVGIQSTKVKLRELNPTTLKLSTINEFMLGQNEPKKFFEILSDPSTYLRIAFASGVSSWRAASAIHSLEFLKGEIGFVYPEGTLAPYSYKFNYTDTKQSILKQMELRQTKLLDTAWNNRDPNLPLKDRNELLILASIIEKESAKESEYKLISSVFVNRLIRGMPLQTDPTVIYGITRGVHTLGRGLKSSELDLDTPWNTYTRRGLPQTPICNPSQEAILAASRPAKTDYLFFLADGTGGHNFAATLSEHNKNVQKWRALNK